MTARPFDSVRRALLAGMLAMGGVADAAYPERPVSLVAPFPPGGAADVLSRLLAKKLEEQLGGPVIVENKPGAGTAIGATAVAKAKPDGYTLLVSSNSTFTLNPVLRPTLPYDPVKHFEPVGMVATVPLTLLVNASVPAQDVKQLVAAVKAQPSRFVYGSFGNGTVSNFAGAMFNAAADVKLTHVPYRGSAPLMSDLLGGQIPMSFDTVVAALPQLKSGKVKALAVTSARRSAMLPDVPTMTEAGFPGVEMISWVAVVAPRGLPADIKARLEKTLASIMASSDTQEKMKAAGFEPTWNALPDWAGFVGSDIDKMKAVAERAQIQAD